MARRASAGSPAEMPATMRRVLVLDALEIGAPLGRRVDRKPHALARNDMAAEEGEEARELRVAGRLGDGAMEGEVLGDGALAALQRPIDGAPRGADGGDLAAAGALGGKGRRLDLDREAQLHHVEHVAQRGGAAARRCGTARPSDSAT